MSKPEIALQVESNAQAPRISRSHLDRIRSNLGARFSDVAIVVSELVTNSVRHSNGAEEIGLKVETSGDSIWVRVTDHGPCFSKDEPRNGGMGLDIVETIADDWGVSHTNGCEVWVEISKSD